VHIGSLWPPTSSYWIVLRYLTQVLDVESTRGVRWIDTINLHRPKLKKPRTGTGTRGGTVVPHVWQPRLIPVRIGFKVVKSCGKTIEAPRVLGQVAVEQQGLHELLEALYVVKVLIHAPLIGVVLDAVQFLVN